MGRKHPAKQALIETSFKMDRQTVLPRENGFTLPKTNSSHLKMDGWNTSYSFPFGENLCSVAFAVIFREGSH